MFLFLFTGDPSGQPGPPPAFFAIIMTLMLVFQMIFTVPSFVAGYALLKRKDWARMAGIIGGVLAAMSFPIGTAVCVYALCFLFGESGKEFYSKLKEARSVRDYRGGALGGPASIMWDTQTINEKEYVPPPQPPNWRE